LIDLDRALSLAILFILLALGAGLAAWFLSEPARTARRRRRLRAQPFPSAWRDILRRRVPLVARLPAALQLQLKRHIQVFVAEKRFVGCAGFEIDDEVRVTIAAQACLLLLNRRIEYFEPLREILVYPSAFAVERTQTDGAGLVQQGRQVMSGESWERGQVILSWDDVLAGAAVLDDGRNVVLHEFAHQLDQETGYANGAPRLLNRRHYARWSRVLGEEFAKLREQIALGAEPAVLDTYGATNPAEFFACATEAFFERPQAFAAVHPALYTEFAGFYRVDPLSW
jgi:Mlc titration factor MtfA (ptsG expression regulator)